VNRESDKRGRRWPRALLAPLACCVLGSAGCTIPQLGIGGPAAGTGSEPTTKATHDWAHDWYNPSAYFKPDPPAPPAEILTLRAEGFVEEPPPEPGTAAAEMAGAHDFYRRGDYSRAEKLFHYHAEKTSNPEMLRAEARFYEAESLRLQGNWPKAADVYVDLLNKYKKNPYREAALQHTFDIANFWMEDTREEWKEIRERRDGKRWVVWPRFVSFDQKKPLIDREGRLIEKLEQVRYNDINGPLADKALFLCGTVKFFNEDYREADFYFSQIYEKHKDSALAAQAIELAIISKHLSTGGADYDGRKVVEARKLVQAAFTAYPELAGDPDKREFLQKQLVACTLQQAEKDYNMAEFWRRTGHSGSAYWYYGLVIQRFPTTDFAKQARQRMEEIKDKVEKENAAKSATPRLPAPQRDSDRQPAVPPQPIPGGLMPGGRP
jgi:TolA-binding protein